MDRRNGKPTPALGFLSVRRDSNDGILGGYLLLNANGRPLEFHCTAPIKPNRAQEILFGPTLEPYLYGEQIGQTLIGKSSEKPIVVFTDTQGVLSARPFVALPVVLVLPGGSGAEMAGGQAAARVDGAHDQGLSRPFCLGRNRLALPSGREADRALVTAGLEAIAEHFDLMEPFERIRGALEEARRQVRQVETSSPGALGAGDAARPRAGRSLEGPV